MTRAVVGEGPHDVGEQIEHMSELDFVLGLLSAVDDRRPGFSWHVNDHGIHQAAEAACDWLRRQAEELGVNPQFIIRRNPNHGDSEAWARMVTEAWGMRALVCRDYVLFSVDPSLKADDKLLNDLPGSRRLYARLAEIFLASYYEGREPDPHILGD